MKILNKYEKFQSAAKEVMQKNLIMMSYTITYQHHLLYGKIRVLEKVATQIQKMIVIGQRLHPLRS